MLLYALCWISSSNATECFPDSLVFALLLLKKPYQDRRWHLATSFIQPPFVKIFYELWVAVPGTTARASSNSSNQSKLKSSKLFSILKPEAVASQCSQDKTQKVYLGHRPCLVWPLPTFPVLLKNHIFSHSLDLITTMLFHILILAKGPPAPYL